MLSFVDPHIRQGRRSFLQVGSLALGGLTLPQLLADKALAARSRRSVTDKSVIFLFMHGGPSQIETFDPKMTAPDGVRSVTGEVQTTVPGMTFGGTLTKLSQWAKEVSIVRSYASGNGNHDIKPIVCAESLKANLGSLYSRVAGLNHPVTGMPTNIALYPPAVDDTTKPTTENFGKFNATGTLGAAYAPFEPGVGGQLQNDMKLSLSRDRLEDRQALLAHLDRLKRTTDSSGLLEGLDKFRQQAFDTILGGVADAFDLSKEDPALVARYDTAGLIRPDEIDKKLNNYRMYVDHVKSLGKLLLLARRLCEKGCGFVTVTTNFVWDNHADVNNAGVEEGMKYCSLAYDHAVSAFLEDVHQRGLSEQILLVTTGEMGWTPRVNKRGGRDHWGNLTPLLLSGGGLEMGKVIGQSTRDAGEPATEPIGIKNLLATIYHTLLDVGELRISQGVPVDIGRVVLNSEVIPGLM